MPVWVLPWSGRCVPRARAIGITVDHGDIVRDEDSPVSRGRSCIQKQILLSQEANTISVGSIVSLEGKNNNNVLFGIKKKFSFWRQCRSEKIFVTWEPNTIFFGSRLISLFGSTVDGSKYISFLVSCERTTQMSWKQSR